MQPRSYCSHLLAPRLINVRNFSSKSGFGLVLTGDSPVVVSEIDAGSPASQTDLRVGDIILEVDGHSCVMATHDQVVELISAGVYLHV